jgi:hypothetical protein
MFKELLSKLFGKSESEPRTLPNQESPRPEREAVTLYVATSASGALVKRYIAKQLQRRPLPDQTQPDTGSMCQYGTNAETVRWLIAVAEDPSTTREVLEHLASHEFSEVRIAVADNPMVSLTLLAQLSRDENPDVRFALAENHQMPVQLLGVLAEDDNPYIAHRAGRTLSRINNSGILKNQFPYRGEAFWNTQRRASSS